jgi:hypothetical protein
MPIAIDSTYRIPGVRDPETLEWARDRIGGAFGVNGWPTFYLIDHKGIVRKSVWELDAEIEKLLAELAAAQPKTAPAP